MCYDTNVNLQIGFRFFTNIIRRALGRAHVPPTKVFLRLAMNKTMPRCSDSRPIRIRVICVIKFCVAALVRCRRKQSGSDIQTIIRIGLKS